MNKKTTTTKKHKPRGRKASHPSARGPFLVPHPLQGIDIELRRQYVASVVGSAVTCFNDQLARLVQLAGEVSPLHVLSILASYSLMKSVDEVVEKVGKGPSQAGQVQQGHVEFMQALLLRHNLVRRESPRPEVMQEVFDLLPSLFEAYSSMRLSTVTADAVGGTDDSEKRATEAVQEFLRGHTAVVRNWGHFSAMQRIASEVFGPADSECNDIYGLTLTQIVSFFEHLVRRLEDSVNAYRKRMFAVLRAGSPSEMGSELAKQFTAIRGVSTLQKILSAASMQPGEARFRILLALEGILPGYLVFNAGSIADELGLDKAATAGVMKLLSLRFGELSESTPKTILLNNPVWLKPIIELEDGIFFSALPQSLMSFVFPIVEGLAEPHPALRQKLLDTRSRYLEDATARLLRRAFPGCKVVRGYTWTEGGKQYESDLALLYDATILLVESKSGGVSWSALRGAPKRMVRQIQELIVAPSDQSARLAGRLKEAIAGSPGAISNFPLPLAKVLAISRLSVTLHDFATVQSIPSLLLEAGLIKSEHRLAPCMTLADLEAVVDILDTPYLRMHYLRRRAELLTTAKTFGDELDSLGMYLDTGFNIGDAEAGGQQLVMVGYSARLDRHYTCLDEGVASKKPRVNLTPWIRALCDQLMERGNVGWYEMAHALLNLNHQDQRNMETEMRTRAKRMRAGKLPKHGLESVVAIPAPYRRMALVFQMRMPDDKRPARDSASNLAAQAFEAAHVETCTVLSFRADIEDLSYVSASLLYRADRQVELRTYL